MDLLGDDEEEEDESDSESAAGGTSASEAEPAAEKRTISKIEAYGADEIREVLVARRRREQEQLRAERIRREIRQAELEHAIFEEELATSASRVGGANPKRLRPVEASFLLGGDSMSCPFYSVDFSFSANKSPLRTIVTGKEAEFRVTMSRELRQRALAKPIVCPGCKTTLKHKRNPDMCKNRSPAPLM